MPAAYGAVSPDHRILYYEKHGIVAVKNRIFETKLYDLFLSGMYTDNADFQMNPEERSQYIVNGFLQMDIVMKNFISILQRSMETVTGNLSRTRAERFF